jgi:hypothetical protein
MSIVSIPVVVPPSGDGPVANIAGLVGQKTVTLSGLFEGTYVLLASHDDVTFNPVLTFSADGNESIRLTLPDAYKSVRVRTSANTSPSGPVALQVAGFFVPGTNLFSQLATFLPGSGGQSAVFDTAILFPPSGLETGINVMCSGGLTGVVLVEGSQDGVGWNPIGSFQAGSQQRPLLGGPPPALEFSPLSTGDNTRYLRFTLSGQVTSTLTLTIGGNIAASSGGAGKSLIVLNEDEGRSASQGPSEGAPSEVILYEWAVDLGDLPAGQLISVGINAAIKSLDPSHTPSPTALFNVYIGATTPGDTTGGTLQTFITTDSSDYVMASSQGAPFVSLGNHCLVQVTGQTTTPSNLGEINQAIIRAITVTVG